MLISEQQEISLGQETDQQISHQYGIYNDQVLADYVTRIGMTIVPYTHRTHLTYHFAVLDSPVVNAFAVPGGYIYVTRGTLAMMNSEAELAVVLGHELGHVNARHSVRRLSKMLLIQSGLALGNAISETFADLSGIAGIGVSLLFLKYSRDDERQADQLGVEYSRKGNYNPGKMIDFFVSLQKAGDLAGGQSLPGFLSTHPLTKERIRNTQAMIVPADSSLYIHRQAFLEHINNIVYGDDPRQGFIEENTFYHPQMRFYFSFPQGWKIQNSPSQVMIAPEKGNAAVVLQAEKSSDKLKSYADKKAANLKGGEFRNERKLSINGMSSLQQTYNINQEEKEDLLARMSFIKYKQHIYTFTALSTSTDFYKYDNQFNMLVNSFNKLSEPKYLNRRPKRIKLIKASGRETLKKIFQKSGIKKDLWPKFSVMNNMELEDTPEQNQLVKIIK